MNCIKEMKDNKKRKYKSLKKSLKIKNKEILQKTGNKFERKRNEWIKEIFNLKLFKIFDTCPFRMKVFITLHSFLLISVNVDLQ